MRQLRVLLPLSAALLAACMASSSALAWGQLGHSIIAELAQRHLAVAAQTELRGLIGEASLASISSWADDYKLTAEGKDTYRWHFVDIDISRLAYDASLDCQAQNDQGTCIVQGLPAAVAILKDRSRSKDNRLRALKLVVHLAGDLEQPLHTSESNGDQGGNKLHVILRTKRSDGAPYTRSSTFHSVWDDSMIDLQAYSWGADALDAAPLPAAEVPPYDEARIAAWANDTHALGIKAYQLLPPGTPNHNDTGHPVELGTDYVSAIKPDLDRELMKGAARLKAILEDALGGS